MDRDPLPCLKEPQWDGRAHAVCRPLSAGASPYMPWLAFGFDAPHTFEFINTDRLPSLDRTAETLEATALANLARRGAEWHAVEVPVAEGQPLHVLAFNADFLAAERILDAAFMQDAARRLNARGVLAGVPRRGLLLATSIDQEAREVSAFGAIVVEEFAGGESAPISPALFAVKDGAIVAVVDEVAAGLLARIESSRRGDDDIDDEHGEDEEEEEGEEDEGAPYIQIVVLQDDQGKSEINILAGGNDGERLAAGVEQAFHQARHTHHTDPSFSGRIQVVVFGYTPAAARPAVRRMTAHLQGVCNDLAAHGVPRIRVTLTMQPDSPFGQAAAPAAPGQAAQPARPAAAAAAPEPPSFSWWTSLPSWFRVGLGLLIGLILLGRILIEMVIAMLP